jgi:hypothetical protein
MKYAVLWTEAAKESYSAILELVMNNYGVNTALKMDDKVEKLLKLLEFNKNLCPPTSKNISVRRCTISKQLSLAYHIVGNNLELLAFYDSRTDINF